MLRGRIILTILSLLLFTVNNHAQQEDSTLASIIRKLEYYTSHVPREEIYLHTDKDEYIAGEDFWFNVYLVDRKSYKLRDESKIAYVEILNQANKPVVTVRVLLKNGTGPGHFVLPDTLNSGEYSVRAYTNLMKNFLPYNCFIKNVTVFNTLKKGNTQVLTNINRPLKHLPGNSPALPALKVNNSRPDSLELNLESSEEYRIENGDINYLLIQTRGNTDFSGRISITGTAVRKCISKNNLSEGINQVIVFNKRGELVLDRFIYTRARKSDLLKISVSDEYTLRDKITIGIDNGNNDLMDARMSISVAPLSDTTGSWGIDDYLVFGSEFNSESGFIPGNILQNLHEQEADSILSRLKSNWILWDNILSEKVPEMKYLPEKDYHFINGVIPGGNLDTIIMCSPSQKPLFQYTKTDSNGNFTFMLHIDEDRKDLIFFPQKSFTELRPVLYSSFSDSYFSYAGRDSMQVGPAHFSRAGVDYQVRRIFGASPAGKQGLPLYKPERTAQIYGTPDLRIKLSDYVELPTMSEIFIELIPGVSLRKNRSGYEILMSERINDRRIDFNPTLMIDGVIIKDAALIADLDPALVDRIEVTSRKYLVGDYLLDGIVNVITKSSDFSCIPLPDYMTRTSYRIAEPSPFFNSPDYSFINSRNNRVPDYRNTLFWDPAVSFTKPVKFWSADNRMKYLISIEGITADGKPFCVRKIFSVE